MPTLTIKIVNTSSVPASNVFIMLQGGGSSDGQFTANTPKTLDTITGGQFTLAANSGVARIYISFNKPVTVGEPFTSQTRFDWVELFYGPPAVSVANLTAVDQFGIPLALQAFDGNDASQGSRAWTSNGTTIIWTLAKLAPTAQVNTADNTFARIQAPPHAPSSYPPWTAYLNSLTGQTVTIIDVFSKAGQSPTQINYSGTFAADSTISLSGTMTLDGKPVPDPSILKIYGPKPPFPPPTNPGIPQLSFAEQAYEANGPYFLGETSPTYHTAGENNAYSVIYRDLIGGLNGGFVGGKFGNSTIDWQGKAPFAAARTTDDGFYNQYAAKIDELSGGQVYGYAFSDVAANPQLTITNSATLTIDILSDSQTFAG